MDQEQFIQNLRDFLLDTDGDTSELALFNEGILKQASDLGIEDAILRRKINLISRDIRWDLFDEIKDQIKNLAIRRRKLLTEADKEEIIDKAAQIGIRRAYVLEKLIPSVLSKVPIIDILTNSDAEKAYAYLQKKLKEGYISSEEITNVFDLLGNQNNESYIIGAIETFLSDHQLKSVSSPTGINLKAQLMSTDWRVFEKPEEQPPEDIDETPTEEKADVYIKDEDVADLTENETTTKAAVINSFKSSATEIIPNEQIIISWDVSDTTTVDILGIGNNLPPKGKRTITPPYSYSYLLKVPDESVSATIEVKVKESNKGYSFEKLVLWIVIIAILGSGYVIYDDYQSKNHAKLPSYLKADKGIVEIACREYAELDTKTKEWSEWKPYNGEVHFFINTRSIRVVMPDQTDELFINSLSKEGDDKAIFSSKNKKGEEFKVEHFFDSNILLIKYENETVRFRPKS